MNPYSLRIDRPRNLTHRLSRDQDLGLVETGSDKCLLSDVPVSPARVLFATGIFDEQHPGSGSGSLAAIAPNSSSLAAVAKPTTLLFKSNSIQLVRESNEILPTDLLLTSKLGEGKFGIVYKGCFKGQTCAVKMLKAGSDSKGSIEYEKLLMENSILAGVGRHPNIAHLFGSCHQEDGSLMIVEEFVEGQELERHLKSKPVGFNLGKPKVRLHSSAATVVEAPEPLDPIFAQAKGSTRLSDHPTRLTAHESGSSLVAGHPQRP